MGVYIKGMKMPESCDACFLPLRYCDYAMKPKGNCPLVEIPPHGRLIDADDLDNHILGHVDTRGCPTIIPADVPDNNVGNIPAEEGV